MQGAEDATGTYAMDTLCSELHGIMGDRDPLALCALWVQIKGACEELREGLRDWDEVDCVASLLERHTGGMARGAPSTPDDPYADGFGRTVNARMLTGSVLRRINHDVVAIAEIVSWLRRERGNHTGGAPHPDGAAE